VQSFISCVRNRTIKIIFHADRLADINGCGNEFPLLVAKVTIGICAALVRNFSKYTDNVSSLIYS
jgi:hypothetical protein